MAVLKLTVQPQTDSAQKAITELKSNIEGIASSLQTITTKSNLNSRIDTLRKGFANLTTQLKTLKGQYADGIFNGLSADVKTAYDRINELNEKVKDGAKLTKDERKELATLSKQLKQYSADLAVTKANNDKVIKTQTSTTNSAQKLQVQFANLLNTLNGLDKSYKKGTFNGIKTETQRYLTEIKGLDSQLKSGALTQEQYDAKVQNATTALQRLTAQTATTRAESKSLHGTLKDVVSGFLKFQLSAMLVMKPLQLIRSALSSINETLVKTEDAVIALQRVLPSGSASDGEISSRLYKIAQDYGQTFENVSQIAQNFARTGMSWADTIKATEAAVLALNVAELDATEASEGLISILTQFNKETSDLTEVVDKLNKAADQNPVTTEKLLKALQRTGAAAKNANISLDDTIGIITTLSKATNRSGENLGTAVNSLIQFSSKASSLDTFAKLGGSVELAVEKYRAGAGSILEIWEELGKVIKDRQGNAESILGSGLFSDEEWAGLNEELKAELGESYADITDIYDTASTFRKNYFIALLNDMENVKKVSGEIADANGYSQAENEKYLDTYTAKLNSLQAKWQDIANDEQGLLGMKKDLVDLGSTLLTVIKWTGGLKTTLIAISGIVAQLFGAKMLASIQTFITTLSTGFKSLQGAAGWIGLILTAVSALAGVIKQGIEEEEEKQRKIIERQNEAIAKTNERIETQKKEVAQMKEVADSVENLRKILDDSSQSEEEKAKAQDKLLHIQNTLVESNNAYKDSLDLANGNLKEQLGLIEQLTTEQLKQKARDFLDKNKSEIEIANSRLETSSKSDSNIIFEGTNPVAHKYKNLLSKIVEQSGLSDNIDVFTDNTYDGYHDFLKKTANAWRERDIVKVLTNMVTEGLWLSAKDWTGIEKAGLSFSGTDEQKIEAITALREYVATHKEELGLSAEDHIALTKELENQLATLNSEEYKQAQLLAERAKATQDWLNGTIDEAEYLKIVYGIEKEISAESDKWTNNIKDVTGKYDDLISKLEELRDLQKESAEWEEKKLAVLEAEQALENAKNQATVRRYNSATGQWEWQTDEKAIKEAEDNLEQARLDLEESAYNNIIDQLEEGTATNESILAILKEVAPLLGEDFATAVKEAIKDKTGVDIDQPVKQIDTNKTEQSDSEQNENHSRLEQLKTRLAEVADDAMPNEVNTSRSKQLKDKLRELADDPMLNEVSPYDSGGIADGLGYMAKATTMPETVNAPDLTAKILSPTSNAEFDRYVRDMGIMFETAREYSQRPIIERVGGNTDNSVNNSGQVIMNGVSVGSDKREESFNNVLRMAGLVNN